MLFLNQYFIYYQYKVNNIILSRDSTTIVSASSDTTIQVWNLLTYQNIITISAHNLSVNSIYYSFDHKKIFSGSADKTIQIWDLQTTQIILKIKTYQQIYIVRFSPDYRVIAAASASPFLKLWDALNGKLLRTLHGHSLFINYISYSQNGQQIVSAGIDCRIMIWKAQQNKQIIRQKDYNLMMSIPQRTMYLKKNKYKQIEAENYLKELFDSDNQQLFILLNIKDQIILFTTSKLIMNQIKQSKYQVLFKSSIYGAARAIIGLPYQHPFQALKTIMQSKNKPISPFVAILQIYNKNGVSGFYCGFIPNMVRVAIKQMYRFPMLLFIPSFIENQSKIFFNLQINSVTSKTLAGFIIAFTEIFILCPAERLKVWLMTRKVRQQNIRYFFKNTNNLIFELFRGLQSSFYKQASSWISFLVADDIIKKKIRSINNIPQTQQLKYNQLVIISITVGLINTISMIPFDMAKTVLQKDGAIKQSILKILINSYKRGGIKMIYAGWEVRFCHYIVQSFLTVNLYDYLETSFKKAQKI